MNSFLDKEFNRQQHYNVLHHLKRIFDIDNGGMSHLAPSMVKELRKQSVLVISNPHLDFSSVDLSDKEYLAVLDDLSEKLQEFQLKPSGSTDLLNKVLYAA